MNKYVMARSKINIIFFLQPGGFEHTHKMLSSENLSLCLCIIFSRVNVYIVDDFGNDGSLRCPEYFNASSHVH